jgi:hypothetical protein
VSFGPPNRTKLEPEINRQAKRRVRRGDVGCELRLPTGGNPLGAISTIVVAPFDMPLLPLMEQSDGYDW